MKSMFYLLTVLAFANSVSAQVDSSKVNKDCKNDSSKMTFKNYDIIFIEKKVCNTTTLTDTTTTKPKKKVDEKFSSWGGIYLGVNGFMTPQGSLNLDSKSKFLELDYSKSITVGFNFAEVKFKIVPKYVGLTTAMGIQWNKYGFKNNYNLFYNSDSVYGVQETFINYRKNKLTAVYLQIPLMLEFKTHERMSKAFHFGVGVVGGYRIGSNLKQEYELNGYETSGKIRGHYQLSPFQAYATFRLGYGNRFDVFANYGLTPVFESKKGPDLRPFTVGIYLPF